MDKRFTPLLGDYPIQSPNEDLLDRRKVAEHFVKTILNLDRRRGVVTSVLGPWGSGKTSFINMAVVQLKKQQYEVLEFNPWMFHGTRQLVGNFFDEISAQMISKERDTSLAQIGDLFCKYGTRLSTKHTTGRILGHLLNNWPRFQLFLAEIGSHLRKKYLKGISLNSRELRKRIEAILNKRNDHPIIVVIDDIDRLPAQEIRDVFQLVRLTASFPNLIYIVSCDHAPIEKALETPGVSGHDYLEKIIQFPFELPKLSRIQVGNQTIIALEQVLSVSASPNLFDRPMWSDIYSDIILPLIRNMRDIRRYAIAIQQALINFDQDIEQVDILALEAIRLFLPDVFKLLPEVMHALTVPPISQYNRDRYESLMHKEDFEMNQSHTANQAQIKRLVDAGRSQGRVVQSMLRYLFPAAKNPKLEPVELLQTRRVAHENILRIYLEQTVDPDLLVFNDARRALDAMKNKTTFEDFWHQKNPQGWWDIILYLEKFENEFLPEHVDSGTTVLLDLLPSIPMLPWRPYRNNKRTVIKIVLRLFQTLGDTTAMENSIHKTLMEVHSLSSKMALVDEIDEKNKTQNKFVSEAAFKNFKELLWEQICSASSDDIAEEYESAQLVHLAKFECRPDNRSYTIENSPKLTFSLLHSAQSRPSGMGPWYNGPPAPRISWDFLSKLYGSEKKLGTCIKTLDAEFENLNPWLEQQDISLGEAQQTLALAREYVQRTLKSQAE